MRHDRGTGGGSAINALVICAFIGAAQPLPAQTSPPSQAAPPVGAVPPAPESDSAAAPVAEDGPPIVVEAPVIVDGMRLPAAEAPKWSICALVSRNVRLSMILRVYPDALPPLIQPTRKPRNPDYAAPPKVPVGSPLPKLGKSRFGMAWSGDFVRIAGDPSLAVEAGRSAVGGRHLSMDRQAMGTCLGMLAGPAEIGDNRQRGFRGFSEAAAEYAMQDTSLPMGFALFDQGRYAEALPFFRDAAKMLTDINGGDEAGLFVGKLLLAGFGKEGPAKGIVWLKRAALASFVERFHMPVFDPKHPDFNTASGEAAMMLGAIYRAGLYGVQPDMAQACRWYRRAAFVGHVAALKVLGDIHYLGLGMPRDAKAAFGYYRRAARRHLPAAQVAVGAMLQQGDDGVKADLPRAIAWYREALRHKNADAAYALAVAYETGDGVKADPEVAFGLYRTAALNGIPAARAVIGSYYRNGTIVPRDETLARRWSELAARDGDADAMFDYGALLANGRGGARDLPRAWAWLNRAADSGNADARAAIVAVETWMTSEDRKAAALLMNGAL